MFRPFMFNAIIGVIKFELILLFVFFISLYLSFCILWDGVFFVLSFNLLCWLVD